MPLVFNQVRNCRLAWKTVIEKLQAEKKKDMLPSRLTSYNDDSRAAEHLGLEQTFLSSHLFSNLLPTF